jgi:hypothetical protein
MHRRLFTFSNRLLVLILSLMMLISLGADTIYAAPDEVGRYPNPVETCQNIVSQTKIASLTLDLLF